VKEIQCIDSISGERIQANYENKFHLDPIYNVNYQKFPKGKSGSPKGFLPQNNNIDRQGW
jgi:hypothetical protein